MNFLASFDCRLCGGSKRGMANVGSQVGLRPGEVLIIERRGARVHLSPIRSQHLFENHVKDDT